MTTENIPCKMSSISKILLIECLCSIVKLELIGKEQKLKMFDGSGLSTTITEPQAQSNNNITLFNYTKGTLDTAQCTIISWRRRAA